MIYRCLISLVLLLGPTATASALTANKVWVEFFPAYIRVYVQYTIPELRQLREAYVEFKEKKEAARFYWSLIRGGDFPLGDPKAVHFTPPKKEPDPW